MGFPNFKNKKDDSVYTPSQYMAYKKRIGKYPKFKAPIGVIFCYNKELFEFILKNHKTTKAKGSYSNMILLNETKSQIAVIKLSVGSPLAAKRMEELIAFGVKKFISIGTAGSLQKKISIGDLVVCEKAIRDEGVSHHYLKPSKYSYPSKTMIAKIKKSLGNTKYFSGSTWTIDAPYRETISEIKKYQKDKVLTVEMEASALFAVGQYRNVDVGAIFTISDSHAGLQWIPKSHSKKTKKSLEILYKVANDVLLN
jgi:uridine phosphorylase